MEENKPIEEKQLNSLIAKAKNLADLDFAHGSILNQLYREGVEGIKYCEQRIEEIQSPELKNAALFCIAKISYEEGDNLEGAVEYAQKISDTDEKNRLLVHLATAVVEKEKDLEKAEKIVSLVENDTKGYLSYFQRKREEIIDQTKKISQNSL